MQGGGGAEASGCVGRRGVTNGQCTLGAGWCSHLPSRKGKRVLSCKDNVRRSGKVQVHDYTTLFVSRRGGMQTKGSSIRFSIVHRSHDSSSDTWYTPPDTQRARADRGQQQILHVEGVRSLCFCGETTCLAIHTHISMLAIPPTTAFFSTHISILSAFLL